MSNNLNKTCYYAFLLGLLMLPFLGFSQQEQPKRVTVVVTAKEIAPQKEVVQLPADNVPTIINGKSKTLLNRKSTTFNAAKSKTAVPQKVQQEKVMTTTPKVAATSRPNSKAPITANISTKTVTTTKPSPKPVTGTPTHKNEVVVKAKPAAPPKMEEKAADKEVVALPPMTGATTAASKEKVNETATNDNQSVVKADQNNDTPQISPDGQRNATSYVWIGIFLIIAGVVLGLLFGKPAFLISFVGVVFVALGMMI